MTLKNIRIRLHLPIPNTTTNMYRSYINFLSDYKERCSKFYLER